MTSGAAPTPPATISRLAACGAIVEGVAERSEHVEHRRRLACRPARCCRGRRAARATVSVSARGIGAIDRIGPAQERIERAVDPAEDVDELPGRGRRRPDPAGRVSVISDAVAHDRFDGDDRALELASPAPYRPRSDRARRRRQSRVPGAPAPGRGSHCRHPARSVSEAALAVGRHRLHSIDGARFAIAVDHGAGGVDRGDAGNAALDRRPADLAGRRGSPCRPVRAC